MQNSFFSQNISTDKSPLSSQNLAALKAAGIKKFSDLLWIIPNKYIILKKPEETKIEVNDFIKLIAKVLRVEKSQKRHFKKGKVELANCTAYLTDQKNTLYKIILYNLYPSQLQRLGELPIISFWGKVEANYPIMTLTSPHWKIGDVDFGILQIDYPTINHVKGEQWSKLFELVPQMAWNNIIDPLPKTLIQKRFQYTLGEAFKTIHSRGNTNNSKVPTSDEILKAKHRLIYHEFFLDYFRMLQRKEILKNSKSQIIKISDAALKSSISLFPYELTEDQLNVIHTIAMNLSEGHPMARLLQGDVGCGKTSVALAISYAINISNNGQVAIMCPTEALALQHFASFKKILPDNFSLGLLLGSTPTKTKKAIYQACQDGEIHILIGTHSLINEHLQFQNLTLTIIDEQHRFGVEQRNGLIAKSTTKHCLLMTATPIPRTLLIAQYGDLDISIINTMPKNRAKRSTRVIDSTNFSQFLSFVMTRVSSLGEQAFFVVPAIEESENLIHLENIYEKTKSWFPKFSIDFVHGKMNSQEKVTKLQNFYDKKTSILVSTSVIEVGIDVPNASIMAIFNPEQFGLSSLHQLRGRVARGTRPGFCFLLAQEKLSNAARNRLMYLEKNEDGFKIAEYDLINRGGGEIFGAIQSGKDMGHKIANFKDHQNIFIELQEDIPEILNHADKINVRRSVEQDSVLSAV